MDTPFTIQSGELRYTCFLPVGLVDLVGSPYVRMDTTFTTESGELQLLLDSECVRPGGSPHLSGWIHYSPQSQVSCSCCQLVNLVNLVGSPRLSGWTHFSPQCQVSCCQLVNIIDLVVLLICQDGHINCHAVR